VDIKEEIGVFRNDGMAKYSDALITFWDWRSNGPKHMIHLAIRNGLDVRVVQYD